MWVRRENPGDVICRRSQEHHEKILGVKRCRLMCSIHVALSDIGAAHGIGWHHVELLPDQGALAGDIQVNTGDS